MLRGLYLFKSLTGKIATAIFLIQALVLTILGYYYVKRFSDEIDARVISNAKLPGRLMNEGALTYSTVTDKESIEGIVGEDIKRAVVFRHDGVIFYSDIASDIDKQFKTVFPDVDFSKRDFSSRETYIENYKERNKSCISSITPLFSENKIIGHLYMQIDTSRAQSRKNTIAFLFLISSLVCFLLTTLVEIFVVESLIVPRLKNMAGCLDSVKKGDLKIRIGNIRSKDEIGSLEEGVNSMITEIEHRTQQRDSAEITLRESERNFKAIFDQAVDGIALVDIEVNKFTLMNETFYTMLGYHKEECNGLKIQDVHSNEDIKKVIDYFSLQLSDRNNMALEILMIRKDGSTFFADIHTRPVSLGGKTYLMSIYRDVTRGKKDAEELNTAYAELKTAKDSLVQSEKMAGIGRLAAGIAHDFNNVLTGIIAGSSLIKKKVEPESSLDKYATMILSGAKHASELTTQLLAFSRRQIIELKVVNFNELIIKMDKMLNSLVRDNIEFKVITTSSLKPVRVDPSQVERIIINLVVNACDALPKGGCITVETSKESYTSEQILHNEAVPPGEYVVMSVTDNGEGMDENTKEHLFEPFYTTKTEGKGTGLGLSSVYGIVKQHKGYITFNSEFGEGTKFKIFFPVADDTSSENITEEQNTDELKGDETVLIVEDNDISRVALTAMLKTLGYNVLSAFNGESALQKVDDYDGNIDIVITDVVMPKMSGKELVSHLKPKYGDIKILFMSGYTDDEITHDGILDKGVNFLQKPFTEHQLASKIYSILGKKV
jgi:PAS domain S-box-containing protein